MLFLQSGGFVGTSSPTNTANLLLVILPLVIVLVSLLAIVFNLLKMRHQQKKLEQQLEELKLTNEWNSRLLNVPLMALCFENINKITEIEFDNPKQGDANKVKIKMEDIRKNALNALNQQKFPANPGTDQLAK